MLDSVERGARAGCPGSNSDPLWGVPGPGTQRGRTVWRGGLAQDTLARGLVVLVLSLVFP